MQNAPWRIEFLGWLRAEMDGQTVTRFATHKTAALLARLALWPRRAHSREELAGLLWPEALDDASRARLRQALTSLRHQLEPPGIESGSVLIADRTHIRLNPSAVSTDVADFEVAVRMKDTAKARRLYKGALLPGFYEEWILDERERLEALFEQLPDESDFDSGVLPDLAAGPQLSASAGESAHEPSRPLVRLPIQFTRFFGRVEELRTVAELLATHRLVTLTGPGGAGKTRLGIEAARGQAGKSDIVFVGLSEMGPSADTSRVADIILGSLARRDSNSAAAASRPAMERLVDALNERTTLLVLDNAEHIAAQAGHVVLNLLSRAASLRILVTSRRRLHIAGEREFSIPPLPAPESDSAGPEDMIAATAVQLFVDRAQTVRPDFQLTARNAADVATLCRRLEGGPLAIELAAARAGTVTPAQMLTNLTQRFEFLATRRSDKDARHRSLWAAISWSVDLLPGALATFWNRLAVFRGGFTAEAAAAVTGEAAAVEMLTQLRDRSLLTAEDCEVEMRFRLLDSLREFAELQWDREERGEIERLHHAYFLGLVQASEEALRGPEQAAWLARLEREHDNLRAALDRGIAAGDANGSQQLAGRLWGFWERRGHMHEARQWLERALELPDPETAHCPATVARAMALDRLGAALNYVGTPAEASDAHQEALAAYLELGDERGAALTWNRLGIAAGKRGDKDAAARAFHEALTRERVLGNRFNMAAALINLGVLAQARRNYSEARGLYAEGLALYRSLDNPSGIADTYLNLAAISLEERRWEDALAELEQAAAAYDGIGDRWGRAYVTFDLAIIARHQDRLTDAQRLAHEALTVCREVGDSEKCADALCQLGIIAHGSGSTTESLNYLREALQIYQDRGQGNSASVCVREIAAVLFTQGTPKKRRVCWARRTS